MARNSTKPASIEATALKAETKSEGMRILYEAGYKVVDVVRVFGVGYAFAYGVAKRAGFAETAAERKADKAPEAKVAKVAKVAKATPKAKAPVAATEPKRGRGRPRKDGLLSGSPEAKAADAAKAPKAKLTDEPVVLTPGQKAYAARKARAALAEQGTNPKTTAGKTTVAGAVKAREHGVTYSGKQAKVPGRPTAARRAANRASTGTGAVSRVASKIAASGK